MMRYGRIVPTSPIHSRLFASSAVVRRMMSASSSIAQPLSETFTTDHPSTAADMLTESAMKIGDLKSKGLCNFTPPGFVESLFEYCHVGFGLPWWATIASCTVAARLILSPLLVSTQKSALKLKEIHPQVQALMKEYEIAKLAQDEVAMAEKMRAIQDIYKSNNVNPAFGLKNAFISGPIFLSFFLALRDISSLSLDSMKHGGLFWFGDLTVPDPYFILPLVATLSHLAVLETGMETGGKGSVPQTNAFKYVMRGIILLGFPFMSTFPSALSFYWFTNSLCTFTLSSALRIPAIRRAVNLAPMQQIQTTAQVSTVDPGFKEGFLSVLRQSKRDNPDHPIFKFILKDTDVPKNTSLKLPKKFESLGK